MAGALLPPPKKWLGGSRGWFSLALWKSGDLGALWRSGHWGGTLKERALEGTVEELALEGAVEELAQQSVFEGLHWSVLWAWVSVSQHAWVSGGRRRAWESRGWECCFQRGPESMKGYLLNTSPTFVVFLLNVCETSSWWVEQRFEEYVPPFWDSNTWGHILIFSCLSWWPRALCDKSL